MPLDLTKHHGAGNDFLVQLDRAGDRPLGPAEVAALCHRRTGVGADGLLRAVPGSGDAALAMELRNADGSAAEMSGNGIRCLVQAAVEAGWVAAGTVPVATAAGLRQVEYRPGPGPGRGWASVDMGAVRLGEELAVGELAGRLAAAGGGDTATVARALAAELGRTERVQLADVGNPHLVLLGPPVDAAVVAAVGPQLEGVAPGGANVEFAWDGPGPGELTLRVWERGAGLTLACGTGSCAVAAVAAACGRGGDEVTVHNPGGALTVSLAGGTARLGGPTVTVAAVRVADDFLAAATAGARAAP